MYNRYLPRGEYVPVEPEGGAPARQAEGGVLSLLSSLLGGGPEGRREGGLSGLLGRLDLDGGDILLVLILVCLYRESGDEEWLLTLVLFLLMGL